MGKISFYKQGNTSALGNINKNMCSWGYSISPYIPNTAGNVTLSLTDFGTFRRYTCTTAGSDGGKYGYPVGDSSTGVLVQGTIYTWSCDVRASKNITTTSNTRFGMEGGGMYSTDLVITTEWKRIKKTWTQTSSYAFVIYPAGAIAVNDWIDIKNLKIEEGSKATPFFLPESESGINGNSLGFIERGNIDPPSFYKDYVESTEFIEI